MKREVTILFSGILLCLIAIGSIAEDNATKPVLCSITSMDLERAEGVDKSLGDQMSSAVITELLRDKRFKVLNYTVRNMILKDAGLVPYYCSDKACAAKAGKLLGVDRIVFGSIEIKDGSYILHLQLVDVATKTLISIVSGRCKCDPADFITSARVLTYELIKRGPSATPPKKVVLPTAPPESARVELTREERQLFLSAVQCGDLSYVKSALSSGKNLVNAKQSDGVAALHVAAFRGHKDIVAILIKNDADLNAKEKRGYTPLYIAVKKRHKEIVKLLAEAGADLNVKHNKGFAPLHWAAYNGFVDIVRVLLAHGADPDCRDSEGLTPLIYLALNCKATNPEDQNAIVELLLGRGADINAESRLRATASATADAYKCKPLYKFLRKKGALK